MKKRWNDMTYNEELDCWIVFLGNHTGYKVRCGDSFNLHLGDGRKLSCRMELGMQWYIVIGRNGTKLYLKPNETYKVDI